MLLINAVKDVASALGDLISATKYASGKSQQDPAMTTLRDSAKVGSASPATVRRETSSLNVGPPLLYISVMVVKPAHVCAQRARDLHSQQALTRRLQ